MAGGFHRAITSLAAIEQKLRRQFGLAGEIGATFKPEMIPVVVVADLREPGNSDGFNSRSWAWASQNGLAAGSTNFSVRFDAPVLITEMILGVLSAGHSLSAYITPPGQSPAVAVAEFAGTWTDNKLSSTDQVPLLQPAGGTFSGPTGTTVIGTNRILSMQSTGIIVSRMQLMMPVGSHMNWQGAGVGGQMVMGMSGRIWP